MGRKNKKNSGILIIILLIILIGVCAGSFGYYELVFKDARKKHNSIKGLDSYDNEVTEKSNEIKKIEEEIEKINSIDLNKNKEAFFKEVKALEDRIIAGTSSAKIAYLTFDDGPYYSTYKFLDVLDKYDVKATFFTTNINGDNCYDNKSYNCHLLYQEYLKRGHTLANHTYTHAIFRGLYSSADSFMKAIEDQENMIKDITGGYVTNITRFPGGSATAGGLKNTIVERLRARGYGYVDWTAQDGDGGDLKSTDAAWKNFTGSINQNIEVVLFHDYNKYTLSILPNAIEYLQNKGYILLPLFYESNMVNK